VCLSVRWDVGLVANRPTSILTTFLPSLERSPFFRNQEL
jgi:hypothetical protein